MTALCFSVQCIILPFRVGKSLALLMRLCFAAPGAKLDIES